MGTKILAIQEGNGFGLQWSNINDNVYSGDLFSMADILGMFVVQVIVYLLILWYMEGIRPGKYGVPRKFYFPFEVL
jgi:hypothetical protein